MKREIGTDFTEVNKIVSNCYMLYYKITSIHEIILDLMGTIGLFNFWLI